MGLAMDAVIAQDNVCEAAICYTGDLFDPERSKYDLKYYVAMGKALRDAGAHVIGLKDMAGLLKPAAARVLIKALKEEVGLPVHFHTHDTSGIAAATVLAAADAGVDAIDAAMDAFSGGTSQPCLGSIVEALRHTDRDTGLDIEAIREISDYWAAVRVQYAAFESGLPAPASEVYLHEMPGGQFTNLKAQARSMGLEDRWAEVARTYSDVNRMFGDIVKVTPSSKVVGDMALMMVAQGLTRKDVEDPGTELAFPDSVVDMLKGNLGQPPGGWPPKLQKKVLKGETPMTGRPGSVMPPSDLEKLRKELRDQISGVAFDNEDFCGYLMYPKVFLDYMGRHRDYGPVRTLPTPVFFYGMEPGQEISAEIDPGKILEVRLQTVGETNEDGDVRVFFELNGQPRTVRVPNRKVQALKPRRPKAETGNPANVAAPMPGVIASVAVEVGKAIKAGDLMLTIEAMKMETGLYADRPGTVKALHVAAGSQVDAKDLLVELDLG
jgi:pyruvate carboxylase